MSEREVFTPSGAQCEACGGALWFYKNERGNWCPCNPDGTDHWDVCRERRYAVAKQGTHVNNKREEAYYGPKGRFAVRETAKTDRRKTAHLNTSCHCDALPWDEPCPVCPAAIRKAA